jgi:hypothetical protein
LERYGDRLSEEELQAFNSGVCHHASSVQEICSRVGNSASGYCAA